MWKKPVPLTDKEIGNILAVRKDYPAVGAVFIEKVLRFDGITLSHNRIHKFLVKKEMSNIEPSNSMTRKYCWV